MADVTLRKANAGEELRDFRGSTVTTTDTDYILTEQDGTEVVLSGDAVQAIQGAKVSDAPSDPSPTVTGATPSGSAAVNAPGKGK